MAEHYVGVYGTRYFSTEPLYFTTAAGIRVWDRVKHRWLNWAALDAKATAESHTWQPREVGIPSLKWQLSNFRGQYYAPGLDDTGGLASEIVVNGDDWTGAPVGSPANTPPTSWTAQNAGTMFQNFTGILDIRGDAVLGGGMTQTLTGTPGEYYVVEIIWTLDQTSGVSVGLDGIFLPLPPVTEGFLSEMASFSFPMPASGTVEIAITAIPGAVAAIDHVRCFLESELTGNPGAGGGGGPVEPPNPVKGPYMAGDTKFWINTDNCMVGFDVDSDPEADIWMSGQEVCESDIEDMVKMAIDAQLQADGCPGLPCMTKQGTVRKKYSNEAEQKAD